MGNKEKRTFVTGMTLTAAFLLWTVAVKTMDLQAIGPGETVVGFAGLNRWFHQLTGVHMELYVMTDWFSLIPIGVCTGFAMMGLGQMIRRGSLLKVDRDILFLGVYYAAVAGAFVIFEIYPVNFRPILIEGALEASYPSSTTLLVLTVMPTLIFQVQYRAKSKSVRRAVAVISGIYSVIMVAGRTISGVHWCTDIIGGILLSAGLFSLYKAVAMPKKNPN